jgi:hypothetical protein
VVLPTDT